MSKYLEFSTPALKHAGELASDYKISNHGLSGLDMVYWNLPDEALYEEAVFRNEGHISHKGPFIVNTGKHTARAANDKYVVLEEETSEDIWWGVYNRPMTTQKFDSLLVRMLAYLQGEEVFVQDCFAGADPAYRLPIRVITEYAWHSLFARNMFITTPNRDELKKHIPEFTIIALPKFKADPRIES